MALVVTIIVLLILAAVAINLTIGNNGIFTRAQEAVDKYEIARMNEMLQINDFSMLIDSFMNTDNPGGTGIPEYIKGIYSIRENKNGNWQIDCVIEMDGNLYRADVNVENGNLTISSAVRVNEVEDIAKPIYFIMSGNYNDNEIEFYEFEDYTMALYKNVTYIIKQQINEDYIYMYIDYYKGKDDPTPGILDGYGDEESPLLIMSIEDLVNFSIKTNSNEIENDSYISLMTDLDFNDDNSYVDPNTTVFGDINGNNVIEPLKTELTTGYGFPPIEQAFSKSDFEGFFGTFDGCNHTIYNLYMNYNEVDEQNNISTRSTMSVSALGLFGIVNGGTVENLTVTGNINASESIDYIGGIIGYGINCNINNCINKVNVTGNTSISIGGILGFASKCQVKDCENYGNISLLGRTENNYEIGVGGICGVVSNNKIITDCKNHGTIKAVTNETNLYKGDISGAGNDYNIENCINEGKIELVDDLEQTDLVTFIGGIVGKIEFIPE